MAHFPGAEWETAQNTIPHLLPEDISDICVSAGAFSAAEATFDAGCVLCEGESGADRTGKYIQ